MSINNPKWVKTLLATIALVLVGALALRFVSVGSRNAAAPSAALAESTPVESPSRPSRMPLLNPNEQTDAEAGEADQPRIPREKVEEFLELRNRSAASLLAGFHALKDTNLLYEAAAKFPNDPQVQWTMLAQPLNPEDRREWLNRFKESSPENSLAYYLSAAEHFKSGQSDTAIKDLLAAGNKSQFKDYAMAAMLDEQELSRFAGLTPFETMQVNGWASDLLGELPPMKLVASSILEARTQYLQAGDPASADALLQAGLGLSDRLTEGEGGRFVISQLVGMAVENIMLKQMDANTRYDSLGGKTPTERQAELTQQKADFRTLTTSLTSAYAAMSESDWQSYSDRMKTYGEVEAMKWLQQLAATRAASGK